ncbi:MAG: glutamyl-tRNA(Gln) amidotransferase, subunit E [Candidatus Syntrophoarchaeum caldarius]|uniref:Glutamyl-tRNA(Gln) amidotransferase subunit E n=1 Tax=Candidatus Syntropharchaeum caldarium TaxID=1838285 RepID=A0A1F2P7U2_9EURY|nr:MAG: glutamyl-tRNA(Gln) amidotransferase, subunit E [Candidatus Syntrophoarchaeum caldarius]
MDRAAEEEFSYNRKFIYKAYDSTCLIENDEEPPRMLNSEALRVALMIGLMLKVDLVDEVHTMRKIVIDGSNTTGFQKTALIGLDGKIEVEGGDVGVSVLCLEEEACQKIGEDESSTIYSLDRLGIPLVEIGTYPDIKSPEHARQVAEEIGMILRSTGRVKRGIGTIRQDINVSIEKGARVEIKGVQELKLIDKIIQNEISRQLNLLKLRDDLKNRGASVVNEIFDVTAVFADTGSKVIRREIKSRDGAVLAVLLRGFNGFVGREIQENRRLGSEFADRAKRFGLGGIFHTDEMPAYGVNEEEVARLKSAVGASENDAVVFAAGRREVLERALDAVLMRAGEALVGVPEETRRALPDGTTAYLRPLPGADRMYPETDVPPVVIDDEILQDIEIPELITAKKKRYVTEYGLNEEIAGEIVRSRYTGVFEEAVAATNLPASVIATALTSTLVEIRREGINIDRIRDEDLLEMFKLLDAGKFAKEAIGNILKEIASSPDTELAIIAERLGIGGVDEGEIEEIIDEIVSSRRSFIIEKGTRAVGPLMGPVMEQLRGKVDGKLVNAILRRKIDEVLEGCDT